MRVTCDSDVLSNFGRRRGRGAREVAAALGSGTLCLNAVTLFETRGGMESAERIADFDRRLGHLVVLPLDRAAAVRAGDLWRELRRRRAPLHVRDLLMAAIADVARVRLLTADTDFAPLVDLGMDIAILAEESEV